MRYWFDTEFIEDGKTIDLISIGIVAEDGREYYAISEEFDHRFASDWVIENVLSQLPDPPLGAKIFQIKPFKWDEPVPKSNLIWNPLGINLSDPSISSREKEGALRWKDRGTIKSEILEFCSPDTYGKPEFWAYYADYDWVVFCQLFGTMMQIPDGFPLYCRDIKQECDRLGNPTLPKKGKGEHSAIADARWNQQAWGFLKERDRG